MLPPFRNSLAHGDAAGIHLCTSCFFALWLLCLSNVDIGVRSLAAARVFG